MSKVCILKYCWYFRHSSSCCTTLLILKSRAVIFNSVATITCNNHDTMTVALGKHLNINIEISCTSEMCSRQSCTKEQRPSPLMSFYYTSYASYFRTESYIDMQTMHIKSCITHAKPMNLKSQTFTVKYSMTVWVLVLVDILTMAGQFLVPLLCIDIVSCSSWIKT